MKQVGAKAASINKRRCNGVEVEGDQIFYDRYHISIWQQKRDTMKTRDSHEGFVVLPATYSTK